MTYMGFSVLIKIIFKDFKSFFLIKGILANSLGLRLIYRSASLKNLTTIAFILPIALVCSQYSLADVFKERAPEDPYSNKALMDRVDELNRRVSMVEFERDDMKRSLEDYGQKTSASNPSNFGGNTRLSLEQEIMLESQVNSKLEIIGKVNGKSLVRQVNDVVILDEKDLKRLLDIQNRLATESILRGDFVDEDLFTEVEQQDQAISPKNTAKNTAKENRIKTARERLEDRRNASAAKKEVEKNNNDKTYRAQSSDSYRSRD